MVILMFSAYKNSHSIAVGISMSNTYKHLQNFTFAIITLNTQQQQQT